MKKIGFIVLSLFVIAGCQKLVVPIQEDFGSKIVYSQEEGYEVEDYKAHCAEKGGVFNTCGTPCGPDVEICAQVCTYTCQIFE